QPDLRRAGDQPRLNQPGSHHGNSSGAAVPSGFGGTAAFVGCCAAAGPDGSLFTESSKWAPGFSRGRRNGGWVPPRSTKRVRVAVLLPRFVDFAPAAPPVL